MSEFLDMGGYASYIWPAYALTAVMMVWILVASARAARHKEHELAELQKNRADRQTGDQNS